MRGDFSVLLQGQGPTQFHRASRGAPAGRAPSRSCRRSPRCPVRRRGRVDQLQRFLVAVGAVSQRVASALSGRRCPVRRRGPAQVGSARGDVVAALPAQRAGIERTASSGNAASPRENAFISPASPCPSPAARLRPDTRPAARRRDDGSIGLELAQRDIGLRARLVRATRRVRRRAAAVAARRNPAIPVQRLIETLEDSAVWPSSSRRSGWAG